ncbi:MAG: helix-hairpin-helix domain-containing protein [Bacteroidota bacterium]
MDNDSIVTLLKSTAGLLELHDENPAKIKSYNNAFFNLERFNDSLAEMSLDALEKIQGVGKSIASKIDEINRTGQLQQREDLLAQTPVGVVEMMDIKGLGVKKIKTLWKELNIDNTKDLLAACDRGEIAKIKGFGEKTQENIRQILKYIESNKGKLHYAQAEQLANELIETYQKQFPNDLISATDEIRRKMEVVNVVKLLIGADNKQAVIKYLDGLEGITASPKSSGPFTWRGNLENSGTPFEVKFCNKTDFYNQLLLTTGSNRHLAVALKEGLNLRELIADRQLSDEEEAYVLADLKYIEPELREAQFEFPLAKENKLPKLLELSDLKGILHNHSTWSDGKHSLEEMARYCQELGYEYLGISDHSKSAFYYANGLKEDRVFEQHKEIDELNKKLAPFKIFKGIESDILPDGRLDYDDDILASFDFIVSSIHSGLSMDIKKATERLLIAIANPFTTMLGHPTGRLLLRRQGYPIDHKTVIDACAQYGVIIEINAHPYRLDLDWRWVNYAIEKGVMISVNPDAHKKEGYADMYYGVCVGRKGGLTKEMTFNSLSLKEVENHFKKRNEKALEAVK